MHFRILYPLKDYFFFFHPLTSHVEWESMYVCACGTEDSLYPHSRPLLKFLLYHIQNYDPNNTRVNLEYGLCASQLLLRVVLITNPSFFNCLPLDVEWLFNRYWISEIAEKWFPQYCEIAVINSTIVNSFYKINILQFRKIIHLVF